MNCCHSGEKEKICTNSSNLNVFTIKHILFWTNHQLPHHLHTVIGKKKFVHLTVSQLAYLPCVSIPTLHFHNKYGGEFAHTLDHLICIIRRNYTSVYNIFSLFLSYHVKHSWDEQDEEQYNVRQWDERKESGRWDAIVLLTSLFKTKRLQQAVIND